jgi:hypothetical protein
MSRRRFRSLAATAVALAATCAFFVPGALGDAGNPIIGTIHGTIVPDNPNDPSGPVTVYVRGQWNWLSHNSDCNFDRAATGVGIIWNDPSGADRTRSVSTATRSGTTVTLTTTTAQTFAVGDHITVAGVSGGTGFNGDFVITARDNTHVKYTSSGTGSGSGGTVTDNDVFNGFKVQKSPITAYVGTQTATSGNPVDQMVHPVDRGNQVEGYTSGTWTSTAQGYTTNTAGDYPQGQAFADPSPPSPNSYASWKGGCGREPLTATASKFGNPEATGLSCADFTTTCAGHPWGSWGYEKGGGLGYSHHFAKRSDVTDVCANFYDVHGGGKFNSGKFQLVNGANEITVNGNGDNSVQTNSFNTAQGANCFSFRITRPQIVTSASGDVTIGDGNPIHDTATLSGGSNPTGSITFKLYAPNPNGTADTACSTLVATLGPVTVNGNGNYQSGPFTPSGTAPQIAGTYQWIASYSGDANNEAVSTGCGDAGEQSVVNKHPSSVPTGQKVLIADFGKVSSSLGTPTGKLNFKLFTNSACTGTPFYNSGDVTLVNGLANTDNAPNGKPPALSSNGSFYWLVSYLGDGNFSPSNSPCGTEQLTISGNTPGVDP